MFCFSSQRLGDSVWFPSNMNNMLGEDKLQVQFINQQCSGNYFLPKDTDR